MSRLSQQISQQLKKKWFIFGLILIPLVTVLDASLTVVRPGLWLKMHRGPDLVIFLVFLLSGMALKMQEVRAGIADLKGTLLAQLTIFIASPLIAFSLSLLPLQAGLLVGLLLVSAMPTTLTSGVVMTGSAGGNMAHALFITVIANSLAVVTIPVTLDLLFQSTGGTRLIDIDQGAILVKLVTLVLIPLFLGVLVRNVFHQVVRPILPYTSKASQACILLTVWMAVCTGRNAIISGFEAIVAVVVIVFCFHGLLLLAAMLLVRLFAIPKGRRESVIFMGGQKTLPLSVILQVSLFPEYGIALVFCVMHHIIHLIMDASLINYLREKE